MSIGANDHVKALESWNTLDNAQAAAYLGCTSKTLRAWVGQRRVPFIRVGRLVRFRRSDLDAWLEARLVPVETGVLGKSTAIR